MYDDMNVPLIVKSIYVSLVHIQTCISAVKGVLNRSQLCMYAISLTRLSSSYTFQKQLTIAGKWEFLIL